jgi:hypothetical protein
MGGAGRVMFMEEVFGARGVQILNAYPVARRTSYCHWQYSLPYIQVEGSSAVATKADS